MPLLCHAVALGKKQITSVAVRDSGVALRHGVPLPALLLSPFCFRAGLTIVPRSLLLNRTKTLATRAMADRESSVALCHGLALKKKRIGRGPRERWRSVPRGGVKKKKKRETEIGRGPRERRRSMPRGGFKKKKKKKKKKKERERSVADRAISIALCHGVALKKGSVEDRERCRSMPRGGVKKKKRKKREICRGPSEQNRSVPRGGVKKKGSVEDRESGVALCHRVALKKRERDQSRTERAVSLCATGWR